MYSNSQASLEVGRQGRIAMFDTGSLDWSGENKQNQAGSQDPWALSMECVIHYSPNLHFTVEKTLLASKSKIPKGEETVHNNQPNFSVFGSRLVITVLSSEVMWDRGDRGRISMWLSKKEMEEEERQLTWSLPIQLQSVYATTTCDPLGKQVPLKLCRMEIAKTL